MRGIMFHRNNHYGARTGLINISPDPELRCILDFTRRSKSPLRTCESTDSKLVVFYLHRKDWRAQTIHDGLVTTLGEEVITYNKVTKYLREARITHADATS
jgi:hypothetical protein